MVCCGEAWRSVLHFGQRGTAFFGTFRLHLARAKSGKIAKCRATGEQKTTRPRKSSFRSPRQHRQAIPQSLRPAVSFPTLPRLPSASHTFRYISARDHHHRCQRAFQYEARPAPIASLVMSAHLVMKIPQKYAIIRCMEKKKTFRVEKRKLLDAAFRAGQLDTDSDDLALEQWQSELQELHPKQTKSEITTAYRAANPRDRNFSQECAAEYNRGLDANLVDLHKQRIKQENNRHKDIIKVRQQILAEFVGADISTKNEKGNIATINPGLLKIFEIKHIEEGNRADGDTPEGTDLTNKLVDAAGLLGTLAKTAGTSDVAAPDGSTDVAKTSGESD